MENYFHLKLDRKKVDEISELGLAHVGDAVFELLVRARLCALGILMPANLHRETVRYVSAPAQAARMDRILPLLTDDELSIYHRGRNAHAHHGAPKNASPIEYAKASGLEALFGALYLRGEQDRANELFIRTMEDDHAL